MEPVGVVAGVVGPVAWRWPRLMVRVSVEKIRAARAKTERNFIWVLLLIL